MHYAAMKGNWPLCEIFSQHDHQLLIQKDDFGMTPRDRAVLWNRRSTSRRMRHAEAEYNLACSTIEHSKLLKLKKKFCKMQLEAIKSLRHDVGFFSDVAFKGFLDEKEMVNGYFTPTLHEAELENGLRQRLRVSGAITDRSVGIETIAAQQAKRTGNRSPKAVSSREPINLGPKPKDQPRARCLTEDITEPLSSKAGLPVKIVVNDSGKPCLESRLTGGFMYQDSDLPKLPTEVIQKACGDIVTFRMKDGYEPNHFQPTHIDDNLKYRVFSENYKTEVQYHVKHTFS